MDDETYELVIAGDPETRDAALGFAHEVYAARELAAQRPESSFTPYDRADELVSLLVLGNGERPVATVSVLADGPLGLPCDATYGAEITELRRSGHRLVEFVRLAALVGDPVPWLVVRELMAFAWVVAEDVLGGTDAVIEVNPGHVTYYEQSGGFSVVGPERACARVRGAPAVLLAAPLGAPAKRSTPLGGWAAREDPRAFFDERERRIVADHARRARSSPRLVRTEESRRPGRYRRP